MVMEMRADVAVPEAELRRRARCLAYRLRQGELVKLRGDEPELEYLGRGCRVPPGSAGVIPQAI